MQHYSASYLDLRKQDIYTNSLASLLRLMIIQKIIAFKLALAHHTQNEGHYTMALFCADEDPMQNKRHSTKTFISVANRRKMTQHATRSISFPLLECEWSLSKQTHAFKAHTPPTTGALASVVKAGTFTQDLAPAYLDVIILLICADVTPSRPARCHGFV